MLLIKLYNILLTKIIFVGIFSLIAPAWPSHAEVEVINGFKLQQCNLSQCVQLYTDKAGRSLIGPNFAFGPAKLVIINKDDQQKKILNAEDGYYDPIRNYVILRGLKNSKFRDLLFKINQGEFQFY